MLKTGSGTVVVAPKLKDLTVRNWQGLHLISAPELVSLCFEELKVCNLNGFGFLHTGYVFGECGFMYYSKRVIISQTSHMLIQFLIYFNRSIVSNTLRLTWKIFR